MFKKQLHRSRINKKIFGVCGGVAEYFNVDPTLVRLGVIAAAVFIASFPIIIIAYIVCAMVMPIEEKPKSDLYLKVD